MADEPAEPPAGDVEEDSLEDSGWVTTKVAAASLRVGKKGKVRKLGRVGEMYRSTPLVEFTSGVARQLLSQALIKSTKPQVLAQAQDKPS